MRNMIPQEMKELKNEKMKAFTGADRRSGAHEKHESSGFLGFWASLVSLASLASLAFLTPLASLASLTPLALGRRAQVTSSNFNPLIF